MKYLLILIILFSSCSVQKKANRKIQWLKSHGFANVKNDTLTKYLPEYRDTGSLKLVIDKDTITEWLKKDTCLTKERINKVLNNVNVKPVLIDNDSIYLSIKLNKGQIEYDFRNKAREIKIPYQKLEAPIIVVEQKWWDKFLFGFISSFILLALFLYLFKK
jgi:hypothetical protein